MKQIIQEKWNQLNRRGIVLMYHRVEELAYDPWQLAVSPANFEAQLGVIKKYGRPVQMNEMGRNIKRFSFGRKEIVISFDDGYADNFHQAKPILERHQTPATFFIVTGSIGSKEEFWWDELERIILLSDILPQHFELRIIDKEYRWQIDSDAQNKALNYNDGVDALPEKNTSISRSKLYFSLWKILSSLNPAQKREALQDIGRWAGQALSARKKYLPMTKEELISLADCRLFEIGAHTVTHPMLSRVLVEKQEEEISRSKRDLEEIIGRLVTSFSYPHGEYSEDTLRIIERSGIKNACTTLEKPVSRRTNLFLLPRFMVLNWNAEIFEQNLCRWLAGPA